MLVMCSFWFVIILLCLSASLFIIPPLWLNSDKITWSIARMPIIYTGLLVSLLVGSSIFLYLKLGNIGNLQGIYAKDNVEKQQTAKLIRPLYADLQRCLVKYELNLPIALQDVDLIIKFAQAESEAASGILPVHVQKLLHAVLNVVPKQVTALNLLAVHAYHTQQYAQALEYWQDILSQFTEDLRNTPIEKVLLDKVATLKSKLDNQKLQ